jgi:hypothetical protein
MSTREVWLPVVGYEGYYEVSDLGRVRSLRRRGTEETIMSTRVEPHRGYSAIDLRRNNRRKRFFVHRLVAEAFLGPKPPGMQTRHLNDMKGDNRLLNLEYGTPSENQMDAVANGVHGQSSKTQCPSGHEYNAENTRLRGGHRHCRRCHAEKERVRRALRKARSANV